MNWLKQLIARLRGGKQEPETSAPEPTPIPEQAPQASPQRWSYRVEVELLTGGGGVRTEPNYGSDYPVKEGDTIPLSLGSMAKVVQVVRQAEPDGIQGELRAEQLSPSPPSV